MIEFRPHHFMCTLGFKGKGYSLSFVRNYKKIVEQLRADPHTKIQVTKHIDSICGACPRQTNEKLCEKQAFIEKLDNAHQEILGLEDKQVIDWTAAKALIKEKMTINAFHAACEGCQWKAYGVCESALKELLIS